MDRPPDTAHMILAADVAGMMWKSDVGCMAGQSGAAISHSFCTPVMPGYSRVFLVPRHNRVPHCAGLVLLGAYYLLWKGCHLTAYLIFSSVGQCPGLGNSNPAPVHNKKLLVTDRQTGR